MTMIVLVSIDDSVSFACFFIMYMCWKSITFFTTTTCFHSKHHSRNTTIVQMVPYMFPILFFSLNTSRRKSQMIIRRKLFLFSTRII